VARWKPLPLAFLFASAATAVDAQEIRWTGTVSYARGSYVFDAPTQTFSVLTGLGLTLGPMDFGGSLPLVLQNSGLVTQVGGTALPTGGEDSGIVGRRGSGETLGTGRGSGSGMGTGGMAQVTYRDAFEWAVGDPYFSASATLYEGEGVLRSFQVRGSSKAPLHDLDSGVSSGEWDFGAGGSAVASLGETYAFVDLSYWWYGDLPELELQDGVGYGVGLSRTVFDSKGSVMVSFYGSAAPIATMDRPASLGVGLGYTPRIGRSFSGGVVVGLSESSPDIALYAGWSLRVH
jgi:hypothetical protein